MKFLLNFFNKEKKTFVQLKRTKSKFINVFGQETLFLHELYPFVYHKHALSYLSQVILS